MVTATGCVPLNEAMNSRDLECGGVPDDICTTLADDVAGHWGAVPELDPIATVRVEPIDCGDAFEPRAMVRCWDVEAIPADGGGYGGIYAQNGDGNLVSPFGGVIGTFPLE